MRTTREWTSADTEECGAAVPQDGWEISTFGTVLMRNTADSTTPVRGPQLGFTLIELLVVIAIIALLVAILVPSLMEAKQLARGVMCLANQKALTTGWVMYADENDGRLVGPSTGTGWVDQGDDGNTFMWVEFNWANDDTHEKKLDGIERGRLFPYVLNMEAYHCPGDARANDPGQRGAYRSYSIAGGMNGRYGYLTEGPQAFGEPFRANHEMTNDSAYYAFVEESQFGGNADFWIIPISPPYDHRWGDPIALWHNDASTLGFGDGHAEIRYWVDRTTIEMGNNQILNHPAPGSEDLQYMKRHYPRK